MNIILKTVLMAIATIFFGRLFAQGCSDAGFCTIGNHKVENEPPENVLYRKEIDLSFTYGTHGKNERYGQPQINYRLFTKKRSFFEVRVPLNMAKDKATNLTYTGAGDIITSYNSNFKPGKKRTLNYSAGLRISFSNADKGILKDMASYPMTLQNGLGTTDLIGVVNYDVQKWISVGTGLQVPFIQYNKNRTLLPGTTSSTTVFGSGYRRKPDALLKLTLHHQWYKLLVNAGLTGIFHLSDDYYKTDFGNYILKGSKGSTINWNADVNYPITKQVLIGLLVAEPFKTRKNIPDGLARSRIVSAKLTCMF